VPSGNFGNITAGLYAKRMGVPFARFIAATNANDVVPRYFHSGAYSPQPSLHTLSNAMDVGNPSNLSRVLAIYEDDLEAVRRDVEAVSISDEDTLKEIRRTYQQTGYVADPHTAVGIFAARERFAPERNRTPAIITATAQPAKFRETIRQALDVEIPLPPDLQKATTLQKQTTKTTSEYRQFRKLLVK